MSDMRSQAYEGTPERCCRTCRLWHSFEHKAKATGYCASGRHRRLVAHELGVAHCQVAWLIMHDDDACPHHSPLVKPEADHA